MYESTVEEFYQLFRGIKPRDFPSRWKFFVEKLKSNDWYRAVAEIHENSPVFAKTYRSISNRIFLYEQSKVDVSWIPNYRDNEGAAVFSLNGKKHRTHGPAVYLENGGIEYWTSGVLHRKTGPAIRYPDGFEAWYTMGRLNRDPKNGPAVRYADGSVQYFVNDIEVPEPESV